ncbi:MAG: hypothetical protein K8R23_12635 [Chthoniobacter sp.]|nr:hypothetical protein [Chthoniobacter sp.]
MPHVATTKAIAKALHRPIKTGLIKIDVRRAVRIAAEYFGELFPQAAKANMMLEEIEESTDGRYWLVTLGYDVATPRGAAMAALYGGVSRSYKTFRIDAVTGKVLSVKIRSAA